MSPRRGVLLALLGVSCVDLARPGARAARPAVLRQRAAEEARERARREALPRLEPERTPTDAAMIRRADDPRRAAAAEGVDRYVFGPLRAEARGEAVAVAPVVPADGVFVVAARAARAWVFVTDRDEVLAGDSFLGPLRRIGSLRCAPLPMGGPGRHVPPGDTPSAARVVLWSDGAAAWTDGASLHFEADDRTRALAWRDERHGARILERVLESTDDGGRTWRAVRSAPGVPMALAGREGALFALTSEGAFRVEEGGVAVASAVPDAPPPGAPRAVSLALQAAAYERYARAPRPPADGCARAARPEPPATETAPFIVSLPVAVDPSGMTDTPAHAEVRAPLGPPERTQAALDVSVMVSFTERLGEATAFAWRAVDAHGRYTARATVTLPAATRRSGWRALTATRQALLLESTCSAADPEDPCAGLVRVSASGAVPLPSVSPYFRVFLTAAGEDGTVALLGDWHTPASTAFMRAFDPYATPAAAVVVVAPDGAVTARIFSTENVVGLGERDGGWGLVTTHDGAWWFRGPDERESAFGQWRATDVRHCTGPSDGAARLHMNHAPIGDAAQHTAFGCRGDCAPIAEVDGFTLRRRAGEAPCVERVRGVHTEYRQGTDGVYDQRQSVCFLSRGRTGVFIDRGDTIAFTSATVHAAGFGDSGY